MLTATLTFWKIFMADRITWIMVGGLSGIEWGTGVKGDEMLWHE